MDENSFDKPFKLRVDMISRMQNCGHSKTLFHEKFYKTARKKFFTVRSGRPWNFLPNNIVNTSSINTLKDKLDKF